MIRLTASLLKIFFRNYRALFFVLAMPAAIYVAISYLGIDNIVRFNGAVSYEQYLLPGILAFSLMQLGLFNTGYALIDMRRSGALKRFAVTPLSAAKFLLANWLARFVMGMLQTAILLLCAFWLFGVNLSFGAVFLPAFIFFGLLLFLDLGGIVAALANDYEDAAPATAVINMVFMFLGDVFFPTRLLPRYLGIVSDILPMKALSDLMRYALFGGRALSAPAVFGFLIWLILATVFGFWIFKKRAYR